MKTLQHLLLALFSLLFCYQVHAQIEMQLQPVRRDFIVGENVALRITITNQTDASIALKNTPGRPWLNLPSPSVANKGLSVP